MSTISWGPRKGETMAVLADDRLVTEFRESKSGATANIAGKEWTFRKDEQTATATDGTKTFEAQGVKPFKQAKRIEATLGKKVAFVNEQKSDWVIEENDTKLAQFTGANHGVRHVEVDVEPSTELDDAQRVFLAWIARIALEERMVGGTWILTIVLLILTPLTLLLFLF